MSSLVTIVVPMYNVALFIEKCAISLFSQTYKNIEYIFINDCTPDNSVEALRQIIINYPERESQVKIINHEVNRGIAATRNTGILHANGVYLLQVDGDDFIHEKTIEVMVAKAIEKNADIVLCDYILNFKNKNIEIKHGFLNKKQYLKDTLSAKIPPSIWNKLVRLDLYKKNNLFFEEGVNYGEDYMLVPKIIYFSKNIVTVDYGLYNYIRWNVQSYTKVITSKHIENLIQVCNELTIFFKNKAEYCDFLTSGIAVKKFDLMREINNFIIFEKVCFSFKEIEFKSNLESKIINFFVNIRFLKIAFLYFHFRRFLASLYSTLKGIK